MKIQRNTGPKFGNTGRRVVMIGYKKTGYLLLHPEEGKFYESRDVRFNEKLVYGDLYKSDSISGWRNVLCEIDSEKWFSEFDNENFEEIESNNNVSENATGRGRPRKRKISEIDSEQVETNETSYGLSDESIHALFAQINGDPKNFREAMVSKDKELWKIAVDEELDSMRKNEVWSIVDRPESVKFAKRPNVISSRWVLKRKTELDGRIRFKARLVVLGFRDKNEYNLNETYAPVSRLPLIRSVFAIINKLDLEVCQLDVKTAFLNGTLNHDIYMEIPDGLEYSKEFKEKKVCKLNKALYGLKISPKRWNERFTKAAVKIGLNAHLNEPCLFTWREGEYFLLLILYVDDILLASNNNEKLVEVKGKLMSEFEMTDLGEPRKFLGMKIKRDRKNKILTMSLENFIDDMLRKFGYSEMHPQKTPMVSRKVLNKMRRDREETEDPLILEETLNPKNCGYREIVGSLLYLSNTVHPDITYAVNVLSRHQINPSGLEWEMVKRVCRYLKYSKEFCLTYKGKTDDLEGFSDASFADCKNSITTSGFVVKLYGDAVAWRTRKQTYLALSTCQAEYVSMSDTCREMVALDNSLKLILDKSFVPMRLWCDNVAANSSAQTSGSNRLGHMVDTKEHYVKECVYNKFVFVEWINSNEQLGDIFTKPLPLLSHVKLTNEIMNLES